MPRRIGPPSIRLWVSRWIQQVIHAELDPPSHAESDPSHTEKHAESDPFATQNRTPPKPIGYCL
ncbi:hypothetical protein XAC2852_1210007 [Xanthomonas citri pv. citri]|uniref:Uncharacterized protein n=1 Tax=Xanthomonas citri pv. citri TaxID=611301 RepID=A0A0U5BQY8_XANCI|nr:hypothetical protein XAC2852_1210007 [Xanthomonas citri pv. citri]CEE62740.1 hypothetical protein XAC3608_2000008 [Xanthomonas citri pv. citri]CEG15377.1 hypothetical protein XAC3562_1930007 [Xanthomonas citri pv. citri]CEH59552.1 hypothetical protein XACLE3_8690008 [Xanthomonas citri pv. citri]CEH82712.1 hypothetical protein XACB302_10550007 [Xanthomonas citri pv. citri]